MKAVVFAYMPNRHFGFLKCDDGKEYFFHVSNFLNGSPQLGQQVTFELGDPVKLGMPKQAVNIRLLAGSAQ